MGAIMLLILCGSCKGAALLLEQQIKRKPPKKQRENVRRKSTEVNNNWFKERTRHQHSRGQDYAGISYKQPS